MNIIKRRLLLVLVCFINLSSSFIQFPFSVRPFLHEFLNGIDADRPFDLSHAVPGSLCNRECVTGDFKVCQFNFTMKTFQIMGGACGNCTKGSLHECLLSKCVLADGVPRGFLSLNMQLPGPTINVCKDDVIVVDLINEAEGVSTSIHWHGMRQFETPFFDGVPFLTQCPISYGSRFRYAFHAEEAGTHFYHSHSGHQKANGVYGALIVRQPAGHHPNTQLYDYDLREHLILASDWMHHSADNDFPGKIRRSVLTESVLINGHGRFYNATTGSYTFAPWTVYNVQPGKRYRFRFINSAFNVCPFMIQIQNHNMTLISSELSYVHAFSIDTLYSLSGERYDFVVDANQPAKDYWMKVKAISPCTEDHETFAILRYGEKHLMTAGFRVDFSDVLPPRATNESFPLKRVFNSPLPKVKDIPFLTLKAFEYDEDLLKNKPDHLFYLFIDSPRLFDKTLYGDGNYNKFMFSTTKTDFNSIGTINNISLEYPSFPLLTQSEMIEESMFCNVSDVYSKRNCINNEFTKACRCIHRFKAKLGSSVEFVMLNIDDLVPHPIHLHGHKFHILDMGIFDVIPDPIDIVKLGKGIPNHTHKMPPYKDTVVLPYPGYVRVRFRADNPGFWLIHCHFDWHLATGMAMVLQVGEISEMAKAPPNFPKCSDFTISSIN